MPVTKSPKKKIVKRAVKAVKGSAKQVVKPAPQPAPIVDTPEYRARLVSQIPLEVLTNLAKAASSEKWLFAVWRVTEGNIYLDRTAVNFPIVDFEKSVSMLSENLRENI